MPKQKKEKDDNVKLDTLTLTENVNIDKLIELFESNINLTDEDYNRLVNFLSGANSITYTATEQFPKGRMYSGNSLQFVQSEIRAFLLKDDWIDLDITQCHVYCLYALANKHNLNCPLLKSYIESGERNLRRAITFYLNDEDDENKKKHPLSKNYKLELDGLIQSIKTLEKVERILTPIYVVERTVIDMTMKILLSKKIAINSYTFDGLIVDRKALDVLDEINASIFPLRLVEKEWKSIKIENKLYDKKRLNWSIDYTYQDCMNDINGRRFSSLGEAHAFILPKLYQTMRIYRDKLIVKTDVPLEGKFTMINPLSIKKHCTFFIKTSQNLSDWIYKYTRLLAVNGVTPKPTNSLKNCFSLFRGLNYKLIPEIEAASKEEREEMLGQIAYEIDVFLHHIKTVICSSNEELYHHFMSWLAFFLKHPYEKSKIAYIFSSTQGAGKSTLAQIMEALLGTWNVAHVCGLDSVTRKFNKHLANKMIVIIEELKSAKETDWITSLNSLKDIIDKEVLTVEPKCVDSYEIENCLNFIGLSNYRHSVPAKDGLDRRFIANWAANIYKGDYVYFKKLQEALKNQDMINMLGTYLYYYDSVENLSILPSTQLKEESQFIFKSEIEKALLILAFLTSAKDNEVWISTSDVITIANIFNLKKLKEQQRIGTYIRYYLGKRHETRQKYHLHHNNDFEITDSLLKNVKEFILDAMDEGDYVENSFNNEGIVRNRLKEQLQNYLDKLKVKDVLNEPKENNVSDEKKSDDEIEEEEY